MFLSLKNGEVTLWRGFKRLIYLTLSLPILFCFFFPSTGFAAVLPAKEGKKMMVATDHVLASQAGLEILRQGGNAIDAACASVFALGVVNPTSSGIGGGGFMLIRLASRKGVKVLDFRERAPAASSSRMFLKRGLRKGASRFGGLAVATPGEVLGCAQAVKLYGRLSLAKVLAPAIRLASNGFPVGRFLARSLRRYAPRLKKHKGITRIFYPNGKPLQMGQRMKRPRLAKTLAAIAAKGSKVFYEGWIAKDIVSTIQKYGGIMTLADLKGYRTTWRKPLQTTYRGFRIFTMPPPSSGGSTIIQILNILRNTSLRAKGQNSSAGLHILIEAIKHAFADRARFLGDADFVKVPLRRLTSQSYANALYKRIGLKTLPPHRYGSRTLPKASPRDKGTSHLSVVDRFGNAVALTTTINTTFGSCVVGERSGIILNNEMDDFTTRPGKPNAFGLIQSTNNEIAPQKRPLSSMSPTIVLRKGKLRLVVGASGGPTIITGTLQVLLNVIEYKLELADAVSRSRIHHQWMPPILFLEQDLSRDVRKNLKRKGHTRQMVWPVPFTAVQAVEVRKGRVFGASDPRKFGEPAGD